jgi:hypothetical protein
MSKIKMDDLNWVPDKAVRMLAAQLIEQLQKTDAHSARASMELTLLDADLPVKHAAFTKKIQNVIETMLPLQPIRPLTDDIVGENYVVVAVLR